jgi:hypothetical protein
MPYIPTAMQSLIQAKAASTLVSGSKFPSIASAFSSGTCPYVLSASTVQSTNVAVGPGAGTQTGRIMGLNARAMSKTMLLKASSVGLSGRDLRKIFDAISFGVVQAANSIMIQGTIIGAGPGTGTGKILGLVPSALTSMILGQAAFRTISGSKLRSIVSSASFGICIHIMSVGTVQLTDIGAAAGPPAGPITIPAAPGFGRLV